VQGSLPMTHGPGEDNASVREGGGVATVQVSVVTPAYREAENLPTLYQRLRTVLDGLGVDWEWIIVDDHSPDATFGVIHDTAARDPRVRGIRLSRNSGAHIALGCGLHAARGACAVALAADLQDPPEVVPQLLDEWRTGAHVVWAARAEREGETAVTKGFSRLYYWLMRNLVGLDSTPAMGADFLLLDRRVLDALREFGESNVSLLALITWMGFRQTSVTYTKQARLHGASGWTVKKKLKLLVDSVTAFSYTPIRFMAYLGCVVAMIGFVYAATVIVNAIVGAPVAGWTSLIVIVLILGGIQMLMMGVLGEYLWRALDESRRRPRFIVEETTVRKNASGVSALGSEEARKGAETPPPAARAD
jgi:polyisoprenyl-phosphate glycosyltransferase